MADGELNVYVDHHRSLVNFDTTDELSARFEGLDKGNATPEFILSNFYLPPQFGNEGMPKPRKRIDWISSLSSVEAAVQTEAFDAATAASPQEAVAAAVLSPKEARAVGIAALPKLPLLPVGVPVVARSRNPLALPLSPLDEATSHPGGHWGTPQVLVQHGPGEPATHAWTPWVRAPEASRPTAVGNKRPRSPSDGVDDAEAVPQQRPPAPAPPVQSADKLWKKRRKLDDRSMAAVETAALAMAAAATPGVFAKLYRRHGCKRCRGASNACPRADGHPDLYDLECSKCTAAGVPCVRQAQHANEPLIDPVAVAAARSREPYHKMLRRIGVRFDDDGS